MAGILSAFFCCCSSSDSPDRSGGSAANPRNETPTEAVAHSTHHEPHSNPQVPRKTDVQSHRHRDRRSSAVRSQGPASDIPLEYVTTADELPEEAAIKGRRSSISVIASQPATRDSSPTQEDSDNASLGAPRHSILETEAGNESVVIDAPLPETLNEQGVLLPHQHGSAKGKKCLVLDLDETLVHSSFKYLWNADFVIPVEIEGTIHDVYVVKRPGVDQFLETVSKMFEVVVFTASVAKYGDPLLDHLDKNHRVHHRLFRESCCNFNGNYVKDLSLLGRPLANVIIIDNSPGAYALQPFNAVPVSSWFSDMHDNELMDMVPFLEDLAGAEVPDVEVVLRSEW